MLKMLYNLIEILITDNHQTLKTRYFCPNKCGKSYERVYTLNRHVRYECGDMRRFFCPCCRKTFRQKKNMQSHAATIHNYLAK